MINFARCISLANRSSQIQADQSSIGNQAMIFIDANEYISLYGIHAGQAIVDRLRELRGVIFVTAQIVEEVQRNKLKKAKEFVANQYGKVYLPQIAIPDHLLGITPDELKELRKEVEAVNQKAKEQKGKLLQLSLRLLREIGQSSDAVSKALMPLFTNALKPTAEELARARDRKERGNPPGKSKDALGDQITWEQFLTHSKGKTNLWIITRDHDYIEEYGGQFILNASLYEDLKNVNKDEPPSVHCFDNVLRGLKHYIELCKPMDTHPPTESEIRDLESDLNSLRCKPLETSYLYISYEDNKIVQLAYKGGYWEGENIRVKLFPKCQMVEIDGVHHELQSLDPIWATFYHNGKLANLTL